MNSPIPSPMRPFDPNSIPKPLAPSAKGTPVAAIARIAFKSSFSPPSTVRFKHSGITKDHDDNQADATRKRVSDTLLNTPKKPAPILRAPQESTPVDDSIKEEDSTTSSSSSLSVAPMEVSAPAAASAAIPETSSEQTLWNTLEKKIKKLNEKVPLLFSLQTTKKRVLQEDIEAIAKDLQSTMDKIKGPVQAALGVREDLYQNRGVSKVVFFVEGKEIPADKFILDQSGCADFFKELYQKGHNGPIEIPNCSVASFEFFLHYIYTPNTSIPKEQLLQLLRLAQRFNMFPLLDECKGVLENLSLVEKALLLPEAIDTPIFSTFRDKVMDSPWSLLPALPYLSAENLVSILESDECAFPDETQAGLFVTAWLICNQATDAQKEALKSHIRYGLLKLEEFFGSDSLVGLYSDEELGKIAKSMARPPENKNDLVIYRRRHPSHQNPIFTENSQFKIKRLGDSVILSGWTCQFPFTQSFEDGHGAKFNLKIDINGKFNIFLNKESGVEGKHQINIFLTAQGVYGNKKKDLLEIPLNQDTLLHTLKVPAGFKGVAFLIVISPA